MNQRIFAIVLTLALLLGLCPLSVWAVEAEDVPAVELEKEPEAENVKLMNATEEWISVEGIEGGKIRFDSSTGMITECEKTVTKADIPAKINGVSVTGIGYLAFRYCSSLTSITIPNGVTSIGDYAFECCTSLTNIIIPNSVTSIGVRAFYGCTSMASITIPNSVTSIGDSTFQDCTGLTSITIPNSVTSIGYEAFRDCTSLMSITIPNGVTSIGVLAFYCCYSLTSISIPNSVTYIGEDAFGFCTSLTSIQVASENPNYSDLNGVLFNKSQTILIAYPARKSEASYSIPNSVTSIEDWAFSYCTNLTNITILNNVTSIGDHVFCYCIRLTSIQVASENPNYSSLNGVLFNKSQTALITYPAGKNAISYSIPNSVTSIWDSAFAYCKSLTSITIPDGITSIGDLAFHACSLLTSITIPNGVMSIENQVFSYCTSLTSVTIPNGITSIGFYAFGYCTNLTSITIPNSVTNIGTSAFSNCTSLKDVYYTGTESQWKAISIDEDGNDCLTNATIHYNSEPSRPLSAPVLTLLSSANLYTDSNARISWNTISGAASYTIKVVDSYGNVAFIDSVSYADTAYKIPKLAAGNYSVSVYAIDQYNTIGATGKAISLTVTKRLCETHTYSSTTGNTCKVCGYVYTPAIETVSSDAVMFSVKDGVPVRSDYYSKRGTVLKTLSKNQKVTVMKKITNSVNKVWYQLSDGEYVYSENLTLTSPPVYTLTLDSNGGETKNGSVKRYEGYSVVLNEVATPTRKNYSFLGWSYDSSATTPMSETSILMNGNKTVYAVWKYSPCNPVANLKAYKPKTGVSDCFLDSEYGKKLSALNGTLSGNMGNDFLAIATSQVGYYEGATGSAGSTEYGRYVGNPTGSWCGFFAFWCARAAGATNAIFPGDATGASIAPFKKQCQVYTWKNLVDGAVKPQAGDLLFYYGNSSSGISSSLNLRDDCSHVEIVTDYTKTNSAEEPYQFHVISGNWSDSVKEKTYTCNSTGKLGNGAHDSRYIYAIVRPNWNGCSTSAAGKTICRFDCPIDIEISYGGETLSTITEDFTSSFGTLIYDEEQDTYTAELNYNIDYDIQITGTDAGTMDLSVEHYDDSGTLISETEFTDVEITTDRVITSSPLIANQGQELYVQDTEGQFEEAWFADANTSVSEPDAELTESMENPFSLTGVEIASSTFESGIVQAEVKNHGEEALSATLFCAAYNENGKMLEIRSCALQLESAESMTKVLSITEEADHVKLFILNDKNTPLCESKTC